MTKTEIALKLAIQYSAIEDEMFSAMEKRDELKKQDNLNEYQLDDLAWYRKEVRRLRSNMDTVQDTRHSLDISDKMWYKALTEAYKLNFPCEVTA